MNWRHVWELSRVNLLYSNPSTLTQIAKKQAKLPKENFSPIRTMLIQQLLMIGLFSLIYIFIFIPADFRQYPGLFSTYIATFLVMGSMQFFTALYSIFYESKDSQHYLPLPVTASEVYLAKILSSVGIGGVFLMPILGLLGIAYWQILGGPFGLIPAVLSFLLIFITVMILATAMTSLLGGLIIRSAHRKIYSTVIMVASYVLIMVPILLVNTLGVEIRNGAADRPLLPYARGFYDIITRPFSMTAGLNFYLPLLVAAGLAFWLYKVRMPRYFQEAFYHKKTDKVRAKATARNSRQILIRHHLSTLGNATLIINTYSFPLICLVSFGGMIRFVSGLDGSFFGIALLAGFIFGFLSAHIMSFLAVATSLEGNNFYFIKSLPFSLNSYLKQKFWLFYSLQIGLPLLFYALVFIWVGLNPVLALSFMFGFAATVYFLGGYVFRRDLRLLEPNWQEINQLFTREGGNWLLIGIMIGVLTLGGLLITGAILLGQLFGMFNVSSVLAIILFVSGIAYYFLVDRKRWQQIDKELC